MSYGLKISRFTRNDMLLRLFTNVSNMSLKKLRHYSYTKSCEKSLQRWYSMAQESGIPALIGFSKMLVRFSYGIINRCRYAIHTSRLEGINKIKALKRKASGFHDEEYFLLIKDAFATSNYIGEEPQNITFSLQVQKYLHQRLPMPWHSPHILPADSCYIQPFSLHQVTHRHAYNLEFLHQLSAIQ